MAHRIDNSTAATTLPALSVATGQPGYFTAGNPVTGQAATIVEADWLNSVQEEIAGVVEGAGISLDRSNNKQLLAAIKGIISQKFSQNSGGFLTNSTADQSYQRAGNYVLGTGNNSDGLVKNLVFAGGAGGDRTRPAVIDSSGNYYGLLTDSSFSGSFSDAGWVRLPGGIIFQWLYLGSTNGVYNFPIRFPGRCFSVIASNANAQGANVDNAFAYIVDSGSFFCATKQSVSNNAISGYAVFVFAIGN